MERCTTKKYTVVLFWLILVFSSAFAGITHNGSIEGLVYHADSRELLAGASIRLEGAQQVSFTNELGYFSFRDLPKGTYRISVSYIGFRTQTIDDILVQDGETNSIKIYLESENINLPEIEVQSDPFRNLQAISALDIRTRPLANAQEMLRIVPGIVLAQHAGGGKAEQIFLRGFDIDHGTDIHIEADGLPVNMVSHAHGQGYADMHFIIPEFVQRIDFRKGPYYADLGNFSTAGSAHLETANALDGSFVKLESGSFDHYRLVTGLDLLRREDQQTLQRAYAGAEVNYANGYFDAPQRFNRINVLAKYNLLVGERKSLIASFSTFSSSWDASGQIPERAVESGQIGRFGAIDPTEGGQTSRTNFSLSYFHNISSRTYTRHQLYYSDYRFELYSNFTFFSRDSIRGDQIRQKEGRSILGYDGKVHHSSELGKMRFDSELGLQLRADLVDDISLAYTQNRSTTLETVAWGDINEINAALYYSGVLWFTPQLSATAGVRIDQFVFDYEDKTTEDYRPQTVTKRLASPKLSLQYQINTRWQAFVQSGLGFHSNDTRVVVAQLGRQILPRAYGLEAGVVGKPFARTFVQLALWRLDLDQEFVYVGDEGIVEPGGKTRRWGVDGSVRYQATKWLFADADINYAYARGLVGGGEKEYIPLAPRLTASGGLRIDLNNGFGAGLRFRYLGDRSANENNSLTADGYFLLDGIVQYRFKQFDLGFQAQNLLNAAWKEAQFETTSRLRGEVQDVTEIHYTPGMPFGLRVYGTWKF